MTVREKIPQMQHPTYLPLLLDGKIPSYLNKWCNKEGIGMLLIRGSRTAWKRLRCP